MGLHFHGHRVGHYKDQGRQEVHLSQAQVNAYDRLNKELELHILKDADKPKATDAQKQVSHFASKLREAVRELRHPEVKPTKEVSAEMKLTTKPKP